MVAVDLAGGWWQRWWVDVEVFFFFSLMLFIVSMDMASGWWQQGWVDVVVVVWMGGCGGRQCWVEKERDRGERDS